MPGDNTIATIEGYLDALLHNKPIELAQLPEGWEGVQERFVRLSETIEQVESFAVNLASGNVDVIPPSRKNFLASGLKQLQSQMLHLTWQTQRIARGDYLQRIDFMGEFSAAFNEMIQQLRIREMNLMDAQRAMERIFNMLEPIIVVQEDDLEDVLYANEMATQSLHVHSGKCDNPSALLKSIVAVPPDDSEHQIYDTETTRWYTVTSRPIQWGNHENARLFYCRDITLHKERETTLDTQANTDPLTGINNRRAFDHSYANLWETCKSAQKPLSIAFFDLDFFKNFNDSYGHPAGDRLLAAFSQILCQNITRADDIVARYGGEEFIAAIAFSGKENAIRMARNVCAMVAAKTIEVVGSDGVQREAGTTVSCGISTIIPTDGIDPSALIATADHALYQAKENGRNQVFYFDIADIPDSVPAIR